MLYVRDKNTFKIVLQCEELGYETIVLDSIEDTQSQIMVPLQTITMDHMFSFVLREGVLWYISGVTLEEDRTTVTMEPVWRMFSRDVIYDGEDYSTMGEFIATVIRNEYIEQSDTFHARPYITIQASDSVEFEAPKDEAGELFSLGEYIETAVFEKDLYFQVTPKRNGIDILITDRHGRGRVVVFNDGHTIFETAAFSDTLVDKVTVIQGETKTDYYATLTGEVSLTPQERLNGEWRVISIDEDADPEEEALKEVVSNKDSYKVEWSSDVDMNVGDTAYFRLEDGTTPVGHILAKTLKSTDTLFHYKSGALPTKLTDKLRRVM